MLEHRQARFDAPGMTRRSVAIFNTSHMWGALSISSSSVVLAPSCRLYVTSVFMRQTTKNRACRHTMMLQEAVLL